MPTATASFSARFDSWSANNPALNLTGDAAKTITFVAETSTGDAGDLFLDAGGAADPDTVVEIDGVKYEFIFELAGTMPTQNSNGAQQVPSDFEGSTVYVITILDYPTAGETSRMAFLPDDTATLADMDAFGNGTIDVQNFDTSPPASRICFCAGTLIDTPDGHVAVEALRIGDTVILADGSTGTILWCHHSEFSWDAAPNKFKPVEIKKGALGQGIPYRTLRLSPQHHIRLTDNGADPAFGPAIAFSKLPGVRQMHGCRSVTYHHILLDRHAALLADGAQAESFFPGPQALKALNFSQRSSLMNALKKNGATLKLYTSSGLRRLSRHSAEAQLEFDQTHREALPLSA